MTLLYVLLAALVVGAVAFGVAVLLNGSDPGLAPAEPDGAAVPLPADRPLSEPDFLALRFEIALRGYRMSQVDTALRRAAYDIGYKEELVAVLEAEVAALRAGRQDEADALHRARLAALTPEAADQPSDLSAEPAHDDTSMPEQSADEPEPSAPGNAPATGPAEPSAASTAAPAEPPAGAAQAGDNRPAEHTGVGSRTGDKS